MSGTKAGAAKAMKTLREKHGDDFHAKIGSLGGKNSSNAQGNAGGFASDIVGVDGLTGRERSRLAGAKGGAISRRKKA